MCEGAFSIHVVVMSGSERWAGMSETQRDVLERDPKGRPGRKEIESIDLLPTSRATELRSHKSERGEGNRVQCRRENEIKVGTFGIFNYRKVDNNKI